MSSESAKGRRFLETRELFLVAFLAAFLVAARAATRWHLHLPGHSMLATGFGLVLVRICVDRRGAATLCGTLAGLVVAVLGMGKGGPLILLKLALPGAVIDLGAAFGSRRQEFGPAREASLDVPGPRALAIGVPGGIVLGALAGLSGIASMVLVEGLAGVDGAVMAWHVLTSGIGKAAFGAIGGGAGAWVGREIDHHGLLPAPGEDVRRDATTG